VELLRSPWAIAALVAVILAVAYLRRVFQRCPHCQRIVRRALRGWLRCPHCQRQYHRSVPRQR
jgi:hypothetical protein